MKAANGKTEEAALLSRLARAAGDSRTGAGRLAALLRRHRELLCPETVEKLADLAREKVRVDAQESLQFAEAALVHALAVHLGEAFRPEVQAGWREVFGLIRRAMLGGFPAVD